MDSPYYPSSTVVVVLAVFLVAYITVLIRNTVRNSIDFYDFLLLSSVAIAPSAFVFFPATSYDLARLVGVLYPFVLLFGLLFLVVFIYLYRLVVQLNSLRRANLTLVQDLALLRAQMEEENRTAETGS